MTMKWKDKKDVALLSLIYNSEIVEVKTQSKKIKREGLLSIVYNNKTMRDVDVVDLYFLSYHTAIVRNILKMYRSNFRTKPLSMLFKNIRKKIENLIYSLH